MTREQAVLRARSAIGHGCIYRNGHGGKNPLKAVPWDEDMTCDCRGLAAWAVGEHRLIWTDTTAIFNFARGWRPYKEVKWAEARPGDLLVYPDRTGTDGLHHEGHVGIIVESSPAGPVRVVHCSSSNFQRESDAICESGPDLWISRGIVARPAVLTD